jgi:choline kinase
VNDSSPRNASSPAATGLVLAAGAGRRLRPHTDALPKTLVRLADGSTVLDRILDNFASQGLTRAAIIVGYCADAILERMDDMEARHGLSLDAVMNDHPEDRNNAYSLWCARDVLMGGNVLLSNGDTVHPPSVQQVLLEDLDAATSIRLAVDAVKTLGDEEMKVDLHPDGRLRAISKELPHSSPGEYIGVALVPAPAAAALVDALERVWSGNPQHFYEAAFQALADDGVAIETRPIGTTSWIEIDSLDDLSTANRLVCHS